MTKTTVVWLLVAAFVLAGSCVFGEVLTVKFEHGDVSLYGLLQAWYAKYEDDALSDTFQLRRAQLGVKGSVYEKIDFNFLAEFAHDPKVLDAYITLKYIPHLDLTFGQMFKPVAYEALTPVPELPFIYYSLPTYYLMAGSWSFENALYATLHQTDRMAFSRDELAMHAWNHVQTYRVAARDLGALATLHCAQDDMEFELQFGVFNGTGLNRSDVNDQKDWVARLKVQPVKGIQVFGNYTYGTYGTKLDYSYGSKRFMFGHEDFQQYSGGLAIDYEGIDLAGEWFGMRREYIHNKYTDMLYEGIYVGPTTPPYHYQMEAKRFFDPDNRGYDMYGWYAYLGYKIDTGHDYFSQVEPLVRFEYLDPNREFINDLQRRITYGLNVMIDKFYAKLQLNYVYNINDSASRKADDVAVAQLQVAF